MASCRGFTLCLLKFFNFILAVLGVLIVIYAAFMIKQTAQSSGGSSPPSGGSSPPSSPPSHSPPSHHKSPPPSPHGDLIQGSNEYYSADLPYIKMPLKGASSWNLALETQLSASSGSGVSSVSWFIWAFLGAGILVIIVTLIGALAAEARSDCLMCTYLIGLFIILILEIAVGLFLYFDKSWRQDLPDDPSGTEHKVEKFIKENIEIFLWGGLGVLAVEILALVFAWLLFCVRTRPREDDELGHQEEGGHEDEYVLAKTGDRHVLIPRSVTQQAPKVTATGPYSMPADDLPTVPEQQGGQPAGNNQGPPELEDRHEKKGVKKFIDNMFSKDK